MLEKVRKNYILLCIIVVGVLFVIAETIGIFWFKAYIKAGDHRAYVLMYFGLIGFLLILFFPFIKRKPAWVCCLTGLFMGYIAGFISVFLLGILQNGIGVWLESYDHYGFKVFGAIIWGATITGSWIIGVMIFYLSRKLYIFPRR